METSKDESGDIEPSEKERNAKLRKSVRIVSPDIKTEESFVREGLPRQVSSASLKRTSITEIDTKKLERQKSDAVLYCKTNKKLDNLSSEPAATTGWKSKRLAERYSILERRRSSNNVDKQFERARSNRSFSIRSNTMPILNDTYDLKAIHEENKQRRQLDLALRTRCHTQPFTEKKQPDDNPSLWNKLRSYDLLIDGKDGYLSHVIPKSTDDQKASVTEARKQSVSSSGLWQMASACVFEYKAHKSHDIRDVAMALVTKRIAVDKMRQRIEKKLDLPEDRFGRLAKLRSNVESIEKKFKSLIQNSSTSAQVKSMEQLHEYTEEEIGPPKFSRPGEAVSFFRKCGRIVLIVLRWIDVIMDSEQNRLEKELKSFVDIATEVEETSASQAMLDNGLTFDKNVYKAKKEIKLTAEHRKILTTRWNFRTPEMIQQVMHGLQTLRSLSEYPLHTQEKLCKVAWYQTIGPKKAIIRQGHKAESFYFVLSGTAFVKKLIQDAKTHESRVQTVARLTKGQSFGFSFEDGEIGLIFNTLRTATVESATPMELLVIGKEDFNRIFMKAEDPDKEADHVQFLRQVPILQHWPVEKLKNEPGTCLLHYFKRGTLITEDGKTSEWLYFIKSGSCNVLKKLRSTKARKSGQIQRKLDPMCDVILPELGSISQSRLDTGLKRRRSQFVMSPEVFDDMSKYYDKLKKKMLEDTSEERERRLNAPLRSSERQKENFKLHLPILHASNSSGHLVTVCENDEEKDLMTAGPGNTRTKKFDLRIPPLLNVQPEGTPGISRSPMDSYHSLRKLHAHFMFPTADKMRSEEPSPRSSLVEESLTNRRGCVFAMIELLHPKDSFGINTLTGWGSDDIDDMLHESPPVSLVSNGAEVVMLSKKIFMKYLNDDVRRTLRETVRAYPKDSVMQDNLQRKLDWEEYKVTVINDWYSKKLEIKDNHMKSQQIE